MSAQGIRAEVDSSGERLGKMIRNGEQEKVPLVAVVGAKEMETNTLSVRGRKGADFGSLAVDVVTAGILDAVEKAGPFIAPPS
mmetsp:Transcript_2757/g.8380  ORF Transcript_2757/g.8380 Transcript_2757/m.8380 type:complete len:83 (+) Transcript_2757:1970-2218(+)